MANTAKNSGIVNSWSLISFKNQFGKLHTGHFQGKDADGKPTTFKSCIFYNDPADKTFVGFSSNLGELSDADIVRRKNDLQVVQLESGNYRLCNIGENSWSEIDL